MCEVLDHEGSLRLLERSVPELVTARPVMAGHRAGGVGEVTKGVICIFSEHADIWDVGKTFSLGWKRCCMLVPHPFGYWEVVVIDVHRPESRYASLSCFWGGTPYWLLPVFYPFLCRKTDYGESCFVSLIGLWSTSESNKAYPGVCLCGYL